MSQTNDLERIRIAEQAGWNSCFDAVKKCLANNPVIIGVLMRDLTSPQVSAIPAEQAQRAMAEDWPSACAE